MELGADNTIVVLLKLLTTDNLRTNSPAMVR